MSDSISKHVARKEADRRRLTGSSTIAKLKSLLSPLQKVFVDDPARFKLARCGRRAGKSFADVVYMLIVALSKPGMPILYLGLTRDSAKEAVWDLLLRIMDDLDIKHEALASGPRIKFPNGSFITLFGADTPNARNRLRGRKFKLIITDEMGFFTQADSLVKSMLPMLADLKGSLVMTSSPGIQLSGLFYEADQGKFKKNWSRYTWTMKDNPHFMVPDDEEPYKTKAERELETLVDMQYGGNWNHPAFRREFLGEWVADDTSLVYPFSDKNIIKELAHIEAAEYAIGIDLGAVSDNAIVVIRFSEYSRKIQIVDCFKQNNLLIEELSTIIKTYIDKYSPTFVIADTGGYGAGIVQELRRRYYLPIEAADKKDKSFHQRIMANELISGYIEVMQGLDILNEWAKITKDETGEEIKGTPNHESDAALYAFKKIYHTTLKMPAIKQTEEEAHIEQLEREVAEIKKEELEMEQDGWYDFYVKE